MGVICHQYVGMDRTAVPFRRLLQALQIEAVIVICYKYRLSIVPSLDQMLRLPFDEIARKTSHSQSPL
jgi:hypothetical protein